MHACLVHARVAHDAASGRQNAASNAAAVLSLLLCQSYQHLDLQVVVHIHVVIGAVGWIIRPLVLCDVIVNARYCRLTPCCSCP